MPRLIAAPSHQGPSPQLVRTCQEMTEAARDNCRLRNETFLFLAGRVVASQAAECLKTSRKLTHLERRIAAHLTANPPHQEDICDKMARLLRRKSDLRHEFAGDRQRLGMMLADTARASSGGLAQVHRPAQIIQGPNGPEILPPVFATMSPHRRATTTG